MIKHVLFYSKFCQYSTDVIQVLTRKDLRARFVMVCVDGNRHQIPHFVDRVPVVLTSDKRLLTDEAVFEFVNGAEGPSSEPMAAELGGGISGEFSFVEGTPASQQEDGVYGYMALTGTDDFPRMYMVEETKAAQGNAGDRGAGGGRPSIDNLLASRENELNSWRVNSDAKPI
jgi:hypothetical protein